MTELICEKCGHEVDPEAAVVELDLFGSHYFHLYCVDTQKELLEVSDVPVSM